MPKSPLKDVEEEAEASVTTSQAKEAPEQAPQQKDEAEPPVPTEKPVEPEPEPPEEAKLVEPPKQEEKPPEKESREEEDDDYDAEAEEKPIDKSPGWSFMSLDLTIAQSQMDGF